MKNLATLCVFALALTGCAKEIQPMEYSAASLERDVTQAMCASDQADRAQAIWRVSNKSEGYELSEVSDTVSDIADRIADKGCPS
jgi:hypothetical protein